VQDPVVLGAGRRQVDTVDHSDVRLRQVGDAGLIQDGWHAGQVVDRTPTLGDVVHSKQSVRLAATKCRLELDHRVPGVSRQPLDDLVEKQFHTLGDEGPAEELAGILVLGWGFALLDLGDVSRELGLLEGALEDILVGDGDLAPGFCCHVLTGSWGLRCFSSQGVGSANHH